MRLTVNSILKDFLKKKRRPVTNRSHNIVVCYLKIGQNIYCFNARLLTKLSLKTQLLTPVLLATLLHSTSSVTTAMLKLPA